MTIQEQVADAVQRVLVYGDNEANSYFHRQMSEMDRGGFDAWLVSMSHPFAEQAGTCESRFTRLVRAMAEVERERKDFPLP